MIAHSVFFNKLQSLNEFSPRWKSVLAGLLVLRLVDDWLDPALDTTCEEWSTASVWDALSNVSSNDVAVPYLRDILDRLHHADPPHITHVAAALQAYGIALRHLGEWHLSRDILETAFRHAKHAKDTELMVRTGIDAMVSLRWLGGITAKNNEYPFIEAQARKLRNPELSLRAKLSIAHTFKDQRLYEEAIQCFDELAPQFETRNDYDRLAGIFSTRAQIAWQRGQTVPALQWGYRALKYVQSTSRRHGILNSIGAALMVGGKPDAAYPILKKITEETSQAHIFQTAAINLLEIAITRSDRSDFNRRRFDLEIDTLLPDQQVYYRYITAVGHRRFGDHRLGIETMREAHHAAVVHKDKYMRSVIHKQLKIWGAPV